MLNMLSPDLQANHLLLNAEYDSKGFESEFVQKVGPYGLSNGTIDLTPDIPYHIINDGIDAYCEYLSILSGTEQGVKVAVEDQGEGGANHLSNPV